ncbi:hypothetical protein Tco_0816297 [Tanacetum coccineum]
MTGNKEKLDDFVKIVGGTMTFGGGDGKITRKGTIRTSKLNFDNVYYVEELQNFNLFSVSQICDTKNKVIFTDKECLVLSKEFQLLENSQVVLRIPRRHNLYCFSLSDIQPERDVTYNEKDSDEEVPGIDAGVQDEGQTGPNPGEQDEGQARPNPVDAVASQPPSSHVVLLTRP